jgi:hypothetical protein
MTEQKTDKIAILWRGDAEARHSATPRNNRFYRIFEELAALGIDAAPAVYDEAFADEVRAQLLAADGVLVWVDPIHQGKTRAALDPLLRAVAAQGVWVSAHPDVILKIGTKEVLYRTKQLGWGSDTHRYGSAEEFRLAFPARLDASGARVLKQNRGNGGQGVWKVERIRRHGARAARAARQRARRDSAARFHGALRSLFRMGRLHHRPAFPGAAARRHDPLLHGGRPRRRFRPPAHQGADPAAARRPRLPGRAAGAAHHARAGRGAVPAS